MTDVLVARHEEQPQPRWYLLDTYLMILEEISYSIADGKTLRNLIEETQTQSPKGVPGGGAI